MLLGGRLPHSCPHVQSLNPGHCSAAPNSALWEDAQGLGWDSVSAVAAAVHAGQRHK